MASASSVVMHAQDVVTVVLLCTANLDLDLAWVIDYSLTQKSCDWSMCTKYGSILIVVGKSFDLTV